MGMRIAKQYEPEPIIEDLWHNRGARPITIYSPLERVQTF